jgi:hypothetical protein
VRRGEELPATHRLRGAERGGFEALRTAVHGGGSKRKTCGLSGCCGVTATGVDYYHFPLSRKDDELPSGQKRQLFKETIENMKPTLSLVFVALMFAHDPGARQTSELSASPGFSGFWD